MSGGAKVALIVLAVVVAAGVALGVLLMAAGWFFYARVVEHESVLMQEAQEAVAVARDEASPPAPPAASPPDAPTAPAAPDAPPAPAADLAARRNAAIERGIAYLLKEQAEDGSWARGDLGVTALCADALLACGRKADDPAVARAVAYMVKAQQPDGGVYNDTALRTYTTSIAVMVLAKADEAKYADVLAKARDYLKAHQWDETESIDKANVWYGGHGYGKSERPDLSNTQYFVQAMHDAGVPKDDPLWEKVTLFVSRTQDRSESNDAAFAGTDSGGMIYTPHAGGESKAGTVDLPDGRKGLKAYGSMTYAGFKSFMYAGLAKDDPRVQAALDWIRRHWTFEENPELGQQGLYYYYETAAKALAANGEPIIRDARRRTHDWRAELTEALLARQTPEGFWVNEADRWFEGFPPVPTSYALIALATCRED